MEHGVRTSCPSNPIQSLRVITVQTLHTRGWCPMWTKIQKKERSVCTCSRDLRSSWQAGGSGGGGISLSVLSCSHADLYQNTQIYGHCRQNLDTSFATLCPLSVNIWLMILSCPISAFQEDYLVLKPNTVKSFFLSSSCDQGSLHWFEAFSIISNSFAQSL